MNTVTVMKAVNSEPRRIKEVLLHFRQYALRDDEPVLKNNGGYTILIRKKGEEYEITKARCGKKDNFNKAVGVNIVRGRMECTRRATSYIFSRSLALYELNHINEKCRERYTADFFERMLAKLV